MQLGLTLGFPHAPVASELEGSGALMLKACVLCFQTQTVHAVKWLQGDLTLYFKK